MLGKLFFDKLMAQEKEILDTQYKTIQNAAKKISASLMNDGVLHLFGIGHSFTPTKEAFFRKGGLVPINPLYDANLLGPFGGVRKIIALESHEEYAKIIFEGHDIREGEVFVQFSITGVSPLTVEVNLEAQRRGLFTIVVTNVSYGNHFAPKHSSGKRLSEVADIVIDNCGIVGDAVIDVPHFDEPIRAGAPATIVAMMIWNMLFLEVVNYYCEAGLEPPIIVPPMKPGDSERNEELFQKYIHRLAKQF